MDRRRRRMYVAIGLSALLPFLPTLWNSFTMDDLYIVLWNPLVHSVHGMWQAFAAPYWPPDLGGQMYRPLPLTLFAADWVTAHGNPVLFHAMNLGWHVAAAVIVTAFALRCAGETAGLAAGLIFAVHPVHVEAVASIVGLAELISAVGVCLSVYAALFPQSVLWSGTALAAGLLSKENAIVAPGLILWSWIVWAERRPVRRRMIAFALSWVIIACGYLLVRETVLHPYERLHAIAPVFLGESGGARVLTAVAALADVWRLLLFPLTLRVDYSPAERTIVRSPLDGRLLLGLACLVLWIALIVLALRRGRRVEAFGLGWIAIAFLPVSNLLFPTGILVAERTLYLPSAGLALAAGAALARLPHARLRLVLPLLVLAGAARAAVRTRVWRNDLTVTASILDDSPRSYRGPARMAVIYQGHREPARALAALAVATRVYDRDPTLFVAGADAALTLGRSRLADSMLARAEQLCYRCSGYYRTQAMAARSRGDSAVADSLLARMR